MFTVQLRFRERDRYNNYIFYVSGKNEEMDEIDGIQAIHNFRVLKGIEERLQNDFKTSSYPLYTNESYNYASIKFRKDQTDEPLANVCNNLKKYDCVELLFTVNKVDIKNKCYLNFIMKNIVLKKRYKINLGVELPFN